MEKDLARTSLPAQRAAKSAVLLLEDIIKKWRLQQCVVPDDSRRSDGTKSKRMLALASKQDNKNRADHLVVPAIIWSAGPGLHILASYHWPNWRCSSPPKSARRGPDLRSAEFGKSWRGASLHVHRFDLHCVRRPILRRLELRN